jgi:predicted negative regulator of RcsB-dependent stress response
MNENATWLVLLSDGSWIFCGVVLAGAICLGISMWQEDRCNRKAREEFEREGRRRRGEGL